MKDTCITVEEQVIIPAIVQEPNEVEQAIDPAWSYIWNYQNKKP